MPDRTAATLPPLRPVEGPDRLPPIDLAAMNEAQRAAAEELIAGPRGDVIGPFIPLLRSAELMDRAQKLGEYLRYRSSIPERLREFAICVVARNWSQAFEWKAHSALALKAGVAIETLAAVRDGAPAPTMPTDERLIFDFVSTLDRERQVDDALYAEATAEWGEQGVVELCGICGYYGLLAMTMNVARTPAAGEPFALPGA